MSREVYRFIIVGILNTAIHTTIALCASYGLNLSIVAANLSGFLAATTFSFIMNTTWTFGQQVRKRFLIRFFLVSALLFSFNWILSVLAEEYHVIPLVAIVAASTITPAISFLLHKFWTYRTLVKSR